MSSSKSKSSKGKQKPKSSKSKEPKKGLKHSDQVILIPDIWVNDLSSHNINDEQWKCNVIMIDESMPEACVYIEHFHEAAVEGSRLSVKAISKLDVIKTVYRNRSEAQPGQTQTPFSRLCTEIYNLVGHDTNKHIPISMLAAVIKYIILQYKDANIKLRENLTTQQKDLKQFQNNLLSTTKDGPPGSSLKSRDKISSKSSKKLGKKSNDETKTSTNKTNKTDKTKIHGSGHQVGKLYTKLRKRGEEWKDIDWIDDAPIEGPQMYIILSTFLEPNLPLELLKYDVPLNAIVDVSVEIDDSFETHIRDSVCSQTATVIAYLLEFRHRSTPYLKTGLKRSITNEALFFQYKKKKLNNFWRILKHLSNSTGTAQLFKDIMFFSFIPQVDLNDLNFEMKQFQGDIYNQISNFVYNIFGTTEQHKMYNKHMKVQNVSDNTLCSLSDMVIYNSLMNETPHEILTIPFILYALLSQVENICQTGTTSENQVSNIANNIFDYRYDFTSIQSIINSLNYDNDLFNKDKILCDEEFPLQKVPKVLMFSDYIAAKTFHMGDFGKFVQGKHIEILQIVWSHIIVNYWTNQVIAHDEFEQLIKEIININKDKENDILTYYIYLLFVDSMIHSSKFVGHSSSKSLSRIICSLLEIKKNSIADESCEIVSTQYTGTESSVDDSNISNVNTSQFSIQNNTFTELFITDLLHIEFMNSDVLLQNLQETSSVFNGYEFQYCPLTEQSIIMLHNMISTPQNQERLWIGKLRTEVPLRDFVEYVLPEEYQWFQWMQKEMEVNQSDILSHYSILGSLANEALCYRFCDLYLDVDFISYRSLKYETLMKEKKKATVVAKSLTSSKGKKHSPQQLKKVKSPKSSKNETKGKAVKGKKQKKETSGKNQIENAPTPDAIKTETIIEEPFTFIGYDLGSPMRCQFTGTTGNILLDDDCKIILNTTKKLYGEDMTCLQVDKLGHTLYHHRNKGENSLIPFHIVHSSGIILYFGRPEVSLDIVTNTEMKGTSAEPTTDCKVQSPRTTYEQNVEEQTAEVEENTPIRNLLNAFQTEITENQFVNIPLSYNLKLSSPAGLYTEMVTSDSQFYIRQQLLSKGPACKNVDGEKYRCILQNGFIVKFMHKGEIEILCANGTIYTCKEFKWEQQDYLENEEFKEPKSNPHISKSSEHENGNAYSENLTHEEDKGKGKTSSKAKWREKSEGKGSKERGKKSSTPKTSSEGTDQITADILATLSVSHFEVIHSDGRRMIVKDNLQETLDPLLMLSSGNIGSNCTMDERLDGTTMQHLADGTLIVTFPDGSRITSTLREAEEEIFCRWTETEYLMWFAQTSMTVEGQCNEDFPLNHSSIVERQSNSGSIGNRSHILEGNQNNGSTGNPSRIGEKQSKTGSAGNPSDVVERQSKTGSGVIKVQSDKCSVASVRALNLEHDGFTLINISYLIEHPNYATIAFNTDTCAVDIKLPFSTNITLDSTGAYEGKFGEDIGLRIDNEKIEFNRLYSGEKMRSTTISTKKEEEIKKVVRVSIKPEDITSMVGEYVKSGSMGTSISNIRKTLSTISLSSELIDLNKKPYCSSIDWYDNEIVIDNYHNIEQKMNNNQHVNKTANMCCFIINKDNSGVKMMNSKDVEEHINKVHASNGLVHQTDDLWNTVFTSTQFIANESEKWLMAYQKTPTTSSTKSWQVSTFGRKKSWIQPFIEKEINHNLNKVPDVVVVRILHKIPAELEILNSLEVAVKNVEAGETSSEPIMKFQYNKLKGQIDLEELFQNPSQIYKVYEFEYKKKEMEDDEFRNNMSTQFLASLIRQSVIKARNLRLKQEEENMKDALRNRTIPPYFESCLGQINMLLEDLLEQVYRPMEKRSEEDLINSIFEKPLQVLTEEDIKFMHLYLKSCSVDKAIQVKEGYIILDILNAGKSLQKYFPHMKAVIELHCKIHEDETPTNTSTG